MYFLWAWSLQGSRFDVFFVVAQPRGSSFDAFFAYVELLGELALMQFYVLAHMGQPLRCILCGAESPGE